MSSNEIDTLLDQRNKLYDINVDWTAKVPVFSDVIHATVDFENAKCPYGRSRGAYVMLYTLNHLARAPDELLVDIFKATITEWDVESIPANVFDMRRMEEAWTASRAETVAAELRNIRLCLATLRLYGLSTDGVRSLASYLKKDMRRVVAINHSSQPILFVTPILTMMESALEYLGPDNAAAQAAFDVYVSQLAIHEAIHAVGTWMSDLSQGAFGRQVAAREAGLGLWWQTSRLGASLDLVIADKRDKRSLSKAPFDPKDISTWSLELVGSLPETPALRALCTETTQDQARFLHHGDLQRFAQTNFFVHQTSKTFSGDIVRVDNVAEFGGRPSSPSTLAPPTASTEQSQTRPRLGPPSYDPKTLSPAEFARLFRGVDIIRQPRET